MEVGYVVSATCACAVKANAKTAIKKALKRGKCWYITGCSKQSLSSTFLWMFILCK